jgi:hypothetical protein
MDDLNQLVEQVWRDLDGQISKARIRRVIDCVAVLFEDAKVTTNIPLFVRHLTREWLKAEMMNHYRAVLDQQAVSEKYERRGPIARAA